MRIIVPGVPRPVPSDLASWEARGFSPPLDVRGPSRGFDRSRHERVVGREPPGDPLRDGPLRRAGMAILRYEIFPPWVLTPVRRRTPLEVGDTVGAFFHPLGARLGGVFFASRVLDRFDGRDATGRLWRVGFTYRTLEEHPECGQETFSAEKDLETGVVLVALRSWSRPGHWLSRALTPLARVLQLRANDAALAALARVTRRRASSAEGARTSST